MENDRVIISDSLEGFTDERLRHYVAHALCLGGRMEFDFNGHHFEFAHGDLMIVRKTALMSDIELSDDFRVKVIYVENGFVEQCTPQSNYGMKGQMALFMNPVMHLEEAQYELCVQDFNSVEFRYHAEGPFHEEGLRCAIQLMIVDFFDFHATLYGEPVLSPQYARIFNGFFGMLDAGAYRKNREVSHYASELCVTAKYLSEICKKVSGHSANFWINRYTTLDITRLLRDRSLTFVQISDMFHFSSPAYFSRYVVHNLGKTPSEFRE